MNPIHRMLKLRLASALVGLATFVSLTAQAPTLRVTPANPTALVGQVLQFSQTGALTTTGIAAGAWHTCLLLSDRTASCLGRNNTGQLGNGTFDDSSAPVRVSGLTNVVSVKTGMEHTCALLADGTMQCWGTNYTGQLGLGGATGEHGGVPFSWSPAPVQGITNAIAAVPGGFHTCAILADRTVQCWGRNLDGQLGNGNDTTDTSLPGPVSNLGSVAALAGGGYHNCALMPDSTVRCWGRNDDGQLGTGDNTRATTPVVVSGLRAAAVSTGGYHSCALLLDGTVQCWGRNEWGQVGQPNTTGAFIVPTTVPGVSNAVAVNAGPYHTCAILANGSAQCWGQNQFGEVGDGTITPSSPPVQVSGIASPSALAVGGWHTCARMPDTSVQCWGWNDYGQLGNGSTTTSPFAVKVTGTGLTWTSSAPTVASIDASGLARGGRRGVTNITVTDGAGASGSTTLTVKEMLTLSVMEQGDGLGTVTSIPGGINCGSTCWSSYLSDSQVTLTAAPAANSTLVGWSGCSAVSGLTCTVTMSAAKTVTATFNLKRFVLGVSKTGIGTGTVTSSPAGITCGSDCSEPYVIGTTVTLTASPALGSVFLNGWSGCDAVSGLTGETCRVTMGAARTVTANFVVGLSLP
jgi:alpha-tubulin suppressor-like RCC1 family protein